MPVTGPDVSRHQGGSIDYGAVRRAGHSFAIIKATEGTSYPYVSWYRANAPRVEAAGLVLGAYHFLRRNNGAAQARYYVNTVGSFRGRIAVVDVEVAATDTYPSPADLREFAAEFRRLVPGHPLVVYTGRWFVVGYWPKGTNVADVGPLWHSEYESTAAEVADGPEGDAYGGWSSCTLWQWTSSGTCPGVPGRCDLNLLRRGTLADLTGAGGATDSPEDDMPVTDDDVRRIALVTAETVWKVPVEGVGGAEGPAEAHLRWANHSAGTAVAMLTQLAKALNPDAIVDEGQIVQGVLAGLDPDAIAAAVVAAMPADQAKRVADELAARLAD